MLIFNQINDKPISNIIVVLELLLLLVVVLDYTTY